MSLLSMPGRDLLLRGALGLALLSATPLLAQSGESPTRVAYFQLNGSVVEQATDPLSMLLGSTSTVSLKELLERFEQAREDDSVGAVILDLAGVSIGLAQLQEVRVALAEVREAGKEVLVHSDSLSNGSYALASAASRLSMVPTGDLWLTGLYAEQPYLGGLLEKIDVHADWVHIGDYKSAGEIFTNRQPSEAADQNMNWLLDGMYEALVEMIADGRGISVEATKALIDDGPYTAERALEVGLIDAVEFRQDFVAELRRKHGSVEIVKDYGGDSGTAMPDNPFDLFNLFSGLLDGGSKASKGPSVAIVYVDGAITLGSGTVDPLGGGTGAKSTSIRKALDHAANDDTVKAVVLRVDSPGGSATASEIILDATKRVAAKKPLIVSMGNVAGSGGYYVACGAHAIFAGPATLTGSIGVVAGKFVTTEMWDGLGVNWKEYKRGRNSGMLSSARAFTDEERARMVGWMTEIYDVFKGHVEAQRGDKLAMPLEELAGGRVYTGKQALNLGLVDYLGGLEDAIAFAAGEAELTEYEIRIIPRPQNIFELLMQDLMGGSDGDQSITISLEKPLFSAAAPVLELLERLEPVRARALLQGLERLELVHREGVITMMPAELVIH